MHFPKVGRYSLKCNKLCLLARMNLPLFCLLDGKSFPASIVFWSITVVRQRLLGIKDPIGQWWIKDPTQSGPLWGEPTRRNLAIKGKPVNTSVGKLTSPHGQRLQQSRRKWRMWMEGEPSILFQLKVVRVSHPWAHSLNNSSKPISILSTCVCWTAPTLVTVGWGEDLHH